MPLRQTPSSICTSAAKTAAPQAVQCADRFHLLKNLGEALEGLLARHLAVHRRGQAEKSLAPPLAEAQAKQPPRQHRKAAELSQAKREERLAKYEQVVALRKQGFSQTAIGEQVGIGHMTVSRWLAHGAFPEYQSPVRKTGVDVHLPYLRERWEAGCHNIAVKRDYHGILSEGSVYKEGAEHAGDQLELLSFSGSEPGHTRLH